MAGSCAPPRTVRVRDYLRGRGRRKPKRVEPSSYWTCKQDVTGRTCGVHHKTMSSAVKHTKTMDRQESIDRARNLRTRAEARKTRFRRWHAVKVG